MKLINVIKTLDEEDEEKIKPRHLKRMVTLTKKPHGSSSEGEKESPEKNLNAEVEEEVERKY
jgi:hypothetical protein